jgi:hypothetical protein
MKKPTSYSRPFVKAMTSPWLTLGAERIADRKQPLYRRLGSRGFNLFLRTIFA